MGEVVACRRKRSWLYHEGEDRYPFSSTANARKVHDNGDGIVGGRKLRFTDSKSKALSQATIGTEVLTS